MRQRKVREFSKVVVTLMLSTYFVGLIVGIIICFRDSSQLYALLAFIATPVGSTLAFYLWKAKHENIAKHQWDYLKKPDNPFDDYGSAG